MDLTTRCPQCGSTFPVTPEQLQLRKGYIRCVSCAHIFDGYEAVVPLSSSSTQAHPGPTSPTSPARQEPSVSLPSVVRGRKPQGSAVHIISAPPASPVGGAARPSFTFSGKKSTLGASGAPNPVFRLGSDESRRSSTVRNPVRRDAAPNEPIIPVTPVIRVGRGARPAHTADVDPIYVEPRQAPQSMQPGPKTSLVPSDTHSSRYQDFTQLIWGALVIVGLAVLFAQAVYVYRAQIAIQIPALRPALERACEPLACTVAYSRHIDEIAIMGSSLRAHPKTSNVSDNEPDSLVLQLTLRNNYGKPQQWPTLVLELKDFSGTVVAKKNIEPRTYLSSQELEHPFAAASEAVVSIPITLNGIKINGYQLSKFFP